MAASVVDRCATDSLRTTTSGPGWRYRRSAGIVRQRDRGFDLDVTGESLAVLGAPDADVLVLAAGEDVVVVDSGAEGVTVTALPSLDTTRSVGSVALRGVTLTEDRVLLGAARRARTGVPDPGVGRGGRRQLGVPADGGRVRQGP